MKESAASNIKGFTCVCSQRGESDASHRKPGFMNSSRSHLAHITSCCVGVRGKNRGGDALPHASSEIFIPVAQRGKQKYVFDPGLGGTGGEEHENP